MRIALQRFRLVMWATITLALLGLSHGARADSSIVFAPATFNVINPERGFYRSYSNDFFTLSLAQLQEYRSAGITLGYAPIRLDDYRATGLPTSFLTKLEASLGNARRAGIKVVLRFTYNYPANEFDYLNAKDAPLAIVKLHISQLAPVVARNRDVIAVLQTGFIGAWGEGHTSSNGLDTTANKTAVMAALLAAMPGDLQILWRYPPDLFEWRVQRLPRYTRIGQHNDCFLSSPTDVGTYSEDATVRAEERRKAAAISFLTFYMGETCAAEPTQIRASCADILQEGRQFHVSSLNRDYYEAFFTAWQNGGCFETVQKLLGYRLRLVDATLTSTGALSINIINEGWARPLSGRKFILSWTDGTGAPREAQVGVTSTSTFSPGKQVTLRADTGISDGTFCLAAPDPNARIAKDTRYALRFANNNNTAVGQVWSAGRFCFRM
jgi:hypothetical protein